MIISLVLFVMAIEDCIHMQVNDVLQIGLLVIVIYMTDITPNSVLVSTLIFLYYLYYERKNVLKIGGADIKIICSLYLLGGIEMIVEILFYASLFGILFALLTKRHKIPFVPFIWLGYVIVNV